MDCVRQILGPHQGAEHKQASLGTNFMDDICLVLHLKENDGSLQRKIMILNLSFSIIRGERRDLDY